MKCRTIKQTNNGKIHRDFKTTSFLVESHQYMNTIYSKYFFSDNLEHVHKKEICHDINTIWDKIVQILLKSRKNTLKFLTISAVIFEEQNFLENIRLYLRCEFMRFTEIHISYSKLKSKNWAPSMRWVFSIRGIFFSSFSCNWNTIFIQNFNFLFVKYPYKYVEVFVNHFWLPLFVNVCEYHFCQLEMDMVSKDL